VLPAIILAAGASSRMGRTKALLPLGGGWFLQRIDATFRSAGVERVLAVVGDDWRAIDEAVRAAGLPLTLVRNPNPSRGQLSSLLAGLDALPPDVPAALVTPVDLPLFTPDTVRRVVSAWEASRAPVVRPSRGARHGHPAVFAASLFDELRAADPSVGARAVVRAHAGEILDVLVDDPGAFDDFDTPQDYERLKACAGDHFSR
jgi:molybdenum cofactor cytidylyltransferase